MPNGQVESGFYLKVLQVEGPADVTITSGMPDAERKERQVSAALFHILMLKGGVSHILYIPTNNIAIDVYQTQASII